MPKVDLHELDALGLILFWNTGITYTNQVAGLECLHPELEGAYVPLFEGVGRPVRHAFTQHFCGDWHPINDSDADIIDGILRRSQLGFIVTDRHRLADSYEAWVFVEVREHIQDSRIPLLTGFGVQRGVLTWPNSD